jgi:hypothetical protein
MRTLICLLALCGLAFADQTPEVKLKLGHYKNKERGIGLVIDLTHHEARIQWDGTKKVIKLDPTHGAGGRIDYVKTINQTVLQVWPDGKAAVFVEGAQDGPIAVWRDGDASPL